MPCRLRPSCAAGSRSRRPQRRPRRRSRDGDRRARGTAYGGGYEAGARANLALAEVHLGEGDHEAALAAARAGHAIADTGDWVLLRADARLALARALDASGDAAQRPSRRSGRSSCTGAGGHGVNRGHTLRSLAVAPG